MTFSLPLPLPSLFLKLPNEEYLRVFKTKNEKKMRKDNRLYEIEIREMDKEKKRIKIHYKGFS